MFVLDLQISFGCFCSFFLMGFLFFCFSFLGDEISNLEELFCYGVDYVVGMVFMDESVYSDYDIVSWMECMEDGFVFSVFINGDEDDVVVRVNQSFSDEVMKLEGIEGIEYFVNVDIDFGLFEFGVFLMLDMLVDLGLCLIDYFLEGFYDVYWLLEFDDFLLLMMNLQGFGVGEVVDFMMMMMVSSEMVIINLEVVMMLELSLFDSGFQLVYFLFVCVEVIDELDFDIVWFMLCRLKVILNLYGDFM